tara:strand:+ start:379 stop:681 length:303 start_codon:yes stop_codon:yes gene_type:complete
MPSKTPAIKKIEIKQILNLQDPLAKTLFFLGIANILFLLIVNKINTTAIDMALQQLVNVLFMLYVLSCFKNGGCNVLAFVISMLAILLLAAELFQRLSVM